MSTQELIEVSLSGVDGEVVQSVAELFDRWGWGGAVIEQIAGERGEASSSIKAYLSAQDHEALRQIEIGLALLSLNDRPLRNHVRTAAHSPCENSGSPLSLQGEGLPQAPLPPLQVRVLAETDWAEAWKVHYHVLHIGRRLVVKPSWLEYNRQAQDVVIEMDPGMAFGSGLHATTRLCLEMLEDTMQPGGTVLDVGTGSGILAIAAGKLGAARVMALDVDSIAVEVAHENVRLNDLEAVIDVRLGTLNGQDLSPLTPLLGVQGWTGKANLTPQPPSLEGKGEEWDIVLANILAETIVDMAPALADSLTPGGILIVGGIIGERAEVVVSKLRACGLGIVERRDDGDWVAFAAER